MFCTANHPEVVEWDERKVPQPRTGGVVLLSPDDMLKQFRLPFVTFELQWFTSPPDIVELGEMARQQKAKLEDREQLGMLREFVVHSIWEAITDLRASNVAYC